MIVNPASFRDPAGRIYEQDNRIFRKVNHSFRDFCDRFLSSAFFQENRSKLIVDTNFVEPETEGLEANDTKGFWLEHEKVDLITYPHEWSFDTLKKVALFHLRLQKKAFANGFMIKDASPYNVQFKNSEPIFIDLLSFEDYQDGAYWVAYNQFCENFLNPLLIKSLSGIEFNTFFRGSIDGISAQLTSKILPLRSYLSFNALTHVHIRAWAEKKIDSSSSNLSISPKSGISSKNLLALWDSLEIYISKLKVKEKTYWGNYETNTSYSDVSEKMKDKYVGEFVKKNSLQKLIDLGCNTGRYSLIAFENGAREVIGLDVDGGAVDKANSNNVLNSQNFIALQFDLMNPSPAIGWRNQERLTLWDRLPKVDGIVCLALIHHICIAKNVPLSEFVNFLFTLSDKILIEFVPKTDPMVVGLLTHRLDVFKDYNEKSFEKEVLKNGKILNIIPIEGSSRKLYECQSN
jgi:ribosomal protein L11 methylase PrmA